MFTIHDGEIIFKEQYGSSIAQRFYVKPPEQTNIVLVDGDKDTNIRNLFTRIFLPQGYPESVSKDYISYQIWDTAQAFCSTITGILATQEVFRGVGVGDTKATPLAATVTWVIKDGCGHLGKILFAYSYGTHLDAYSKKWRLYADVLNDAAMCLEIALPMFKDQTTAILCCSTVMKAIVGVAGGATRAAMTQHHAIRGNLADVSAKDSAQETAVNLIASLTALAILSVLGNSLYVFAIMMIFHIVFNYMAVRAVCLRTFNEPRLLQVIDAYLREEIIANPCAINRVEPIMFYRMGTSVLDWTLCGFHIVAGHSMKQAVSRHPRARFLKNVQEIYGNNQYILLPNMETRKMYIVLRDTATHVDVIHSYFHAVLLAISICAINNYPLGIYQNPKNASRPFAKICETLQNVEWCREVMETPMDTFTYEPSIELMAYLNRIVTKEWQGLHSGLQKIGWDLSKHLLIVEEWRICTTTLRDRHISVGQSFTTDVLSFSESNPILKTFGDFYDSTADLSNQENAFTIEPERPISEEKIPKPKDKKELETSDSQDSKSSKKEEPKKKDAESSKKEDPKSSKKEHHKSSKKEHSKSTKKD